MNKLKNFLKDLWRNEWTPASLLTKTTGGHWIEYHTPFVSFFGTETGCWIDETERTPFGKFVDNLPGIIAFPFMLL